jgi:hypothetical protein
MFSNRTGGGDTERREGTRPPQDSNFIRRSRLGLDPGTLGFEPGSTRAFVVIRVSWPETSVDPPTSADVLSNRLPWLRDWLHSLGSGVSSVVQIYGSDDLKIEVRIEKPS